MILARVICLVAGYAFGLLQTSYIYGRMKGIDIREHGSGNAGTTNALRVLGKKAGLIVFIGDLFKAIIISAIVHVVIGHLYPNEVYLYLAYAGLGTVLGHNFPCYLHFKGGKGIATTAAAMMAFDWRIGLCCFIIFVVVTAATRYVSLASILLSAGIVVEVLIFHPGRWDLFAMCVLYAFFAIYRHRANIGRLLSGTESKIGQKVEVKK